MVLACCGVCHYVATGVMCLRTRVSRWRHASSSLLNHSRAREGLTRPDSCEATWALAGFCCWCESEGDFAMSPKTSCHAPLMDASSSCVHLLFTRIVRGRLSSQHARGEAGQVRVALLLLLSRVASTRAGAEASPSFKEGTSLLAGPSAMCYRQRNAVEHLTQGSEPVSPFWSFRRDGRNVVKLVGTVSRPVGITI